MQRILFLTNIDHGAEETMTKLMNDNGYDVRIRRKAEDLAGGADLEGVSLVIISQEIPLDYLDTCRIIRTHSNVPIIVLTDHTDSVDMVVALEMGADDFVSVPYERIELVARIRSLLRRVVLGDDGTHLDRSKSTSEQIVIGPLKIDCHFQDAFVIDKPVGLTNLEFKLLYFFVIHQEQLLTKEEIFTSIWGYDIATNSHSLATYIHSLKKKLRSHGVWLPLESFPHVGYKLGPATIINLFSAEEKEDAG